MPNEIWVPGDHLETLTRLTTSMGLETLPEAVIRAGRLNLIDNVGAILAGMQEPSLHRLAGQMADNSSAPVSRVLGSVRCCDAHWAALVNATAGGVLRLDPGNRFSGGNPGIHPLAAGIAVAERERASGKKLLEAILAGYEVAARVGRATTLRPGMHPNGSWTVVGAAVAAGVLMAFDAAELRQAINLSTTFNLATSVRALGEGATVFDVYSGFSAAMGIVAADLVRDGFTAERDGLQNVFGQVAGEFFDGEKATVEAGRRWEIERGYHTMHACDRRMHSAIDAMGALTAAENVDVAEIERIEVATHAAAAALNAYAPENPSAAKASLPFVLSAYLYLKHAGVDAFTPEVIADRRIRELAKRILVREEVTFSQRLPGEWPAVVRIRLRDGQELQSGCTLPTGEPDGEPYGDEIIRSKFESLAGKALKPAAVSRALSLLGGIETLDDVRELTACLTPNGDDQRA